MSEPIPQLPVDTTIRGKADIIVDFKPIPDPEKEGAFITPARKRVSVKLVPIEEFGKYIELVLNLGKFIEYMTDQEPGWNRTIEEESFYAIDAKARELNDPRCDRYLQRQKAAVSKVIPMANEVRDLTNSVQTASPVA